MAAIPIDSEKFTATVCSCTYTVDCCCHDKGLMKSVKVVSHISNNWNTCVRVFKIDMYIVDQLWQLIVLPKITPHPYAHKFKPIAQLNISSSIPTRYAKQHGPSGAFGPANNPNNAQAT